MHTWTNPTQAQHELTNEGWDWLIHSSRAIEEIEERAKWASFFWKSDRVLGIDRANSRSPHKFKLNTICTTDEKYSNVSWADLDAAVGDFIKPGQKVLLDMCLLGFDTVLYLLPALKKLELSSLGILYLCPNRYEFPKDPITDLLLHPINQPKGYLASFARVADEGACLHLIILGFDPARAWKFINERAWKLENVHIVIGDPPFVKEGVEKAIAAAEPWFKQFELSHPTHIHRVAAENPSHLELLCKKLLEKNPGKWLDIVPIGPKPMNLGVLAFYFSLNELQQTKVRLLYDFPTQQAPRSIGIGKIYRYEYCL
jgi:hypothetical protein